MSLTLRTAINGAPSSAAIIIPGKPALTVTYQGLIAEVDKFQAKLAAVGITRGSPVSIATVNSYEFIVSFLAASWQRAIAAPLNPAYKQDEFEFYIEDVKSAIVLVPRGAYQSGSPAVKAAKRFNAAIAECYWDPARREVALDVKEMGQLQGKGRQAVHTAQPDDVALVLHTRWVFHDLPVPREQAFGDADKKNPMIKRNYLAAQSGKPIASRRLVNSTALNLTPYPPY